MALFHTVRNDYGLWFYPIETDPDNRLIAVTAAWDEFYNTEATEENIKFIRDKSLELLRLCDIHSNTSSLLKIESK